ncbi:MAG: hypothetical protein PVI90_04870, partial [Desulfobacteraceae bacterium]
MYNISIYNLNTICQSLKGGILWIALAIGIMGCAAMNQPPASQPSQEDKVVEKKTLPERHTDQTENKAEKETKVIPPKSIAVWIPKGSGAFIVDTNRVFHGIGGATGSSIPILLRASADKNSREELSKVVTQFVTFVIETYWNKGGGRESSDVGNLEVLNNAFLAVAQNTLSSSRIAGHWQDPDSGEFYALCQLPL